MSNTHTPQELASHSSQVLAFENECDAWFVRKNYSTLFEGYLLKNQEDYDKAVESERAELKAIYDRKFCLRNMSPLATEMLMSF